MEQRPLPEPYAADDPVETEASPAEPHLELLPGAALDEPDAPEEEEEDDEPAFVRTAVLKKNDMLALLSLKSGDSGGQIVRFDPREPLPSMQRYESETEALKWFTRSLATSRKNGWSLVYDGQPMVG